jgi:hypothetical protein
MSWRSVVVATFRGIIPLFVKLYTESLGAKVAGGNMVVVLIADKKYADFKKNYDDGLANLLGRFE